MKILHLIKSEPGEIPSRIIKQHEKKHEVKVINLLNKDVSFESVIDDIFAYDKVISW